MSAPMSDRLLAGHAPFSMYQRSTAALIVALLWALTFGLAVSLETATRGTMIAAMIPRIVTTANSSISEKPLRLRLPKRVHVVLSTSADTSVRGTRTTGPTRLRVTQTVFRRFVCPNVGHSKFAGNANCEEFSAARCSLVGVANNAVQWLY